MADGKEAADRPEDQSAASPERARHWAAFYQELISYEERILESMRELSAGMSAGQKEAVRKTNLEPLEELIDDFRRRLALWRRRIEAEEIQGGEGSQSEHFRQSPPNTPTV
jgi:hypothetical protein